MACPFCGSKDVRSAEQGVFIYSYNCNACKKSYRRANPGTVATIASVATGAIIGHFSHHSGDNGETTHADGLDHSSDFLHDDYDLSSLDELTDYDMD